MSPTEILYEFLYFSSKFFFISSSKFFFFFSVNHLLKQLCKMFQFKVTEIGEKVRLKQICIFLSILYILLTGGFDSLRMRQSSNRNKLER
jgi:hypothetical protein